MPVIPDLNQAFKNSIKDDYKIFDNWETMLLEHITDNATVNFDDGTAARNVNTIEVPYCLQRQPSRRNGGSVPQLHERSVSIQKDAFDKFDTVIEVPKSFTNDEGELIVVQIRTNDVITRSKTTGERYRIQMLDNSTLETRWRLGCSRLG